MHKLWAGRFTKKTDEGVNAFNSSLKFDRRMWKQDIRGSAAHAKMLGKQGIIPEEDTKLIVCGLNEIKNDIESGKLRFDTDSEDIHMFIETELTARIGDAGKRLHTARSRNDQVATDLRLCLAEEIDEIKGLILKLRETLHEIALKYKNAIMPGYTHLQRAQPITFAYHLSAYSQMFSRDCSRLDNAKKHTLRDMPLGSCALAGTTYPIDREITAEELGFESPCENTLDGVSDRDFCIEFLSALSIIMVHLSRFSEEIILWCSREFNFIELDDAFATGSSIMPQKKNPDVAELVRGKSGRVFGDLMTMLTVMKGLPLAYNKDMQEDKECVFDAADTVKICLKTFAPMLASMTVLKENMRSAVSGGFVNATDCADYLVRKGLPFRDAYKITGTIVGYCLGKNTDLENLPLDEYKKHSELFDEDIYAAVNPENCAGKRKIFGL